MIRELEAELVKAKADKASVVAPYDKRIKSLKMAIKKVKEFNAVSSEINQTDKNEVSLVPESIER